MSNIIVENGVVTRHILMMVNRVRNRRLWAVISIERDFFIIVIGQQAKITEINIFIHCIGRIVQNAL